MRYQCTSHPDAGGLCFQCLELAVKRERFNSPEAHFQFRAMIRFSIVHYRSSVEMPSRGGGEGTSSGVNSNLVD